MPDQQPPQDKQLVQSLSRGLAVIRSFDSSRPRQTLTQVAEATGLARATARRFLHTLVAEGYARTDGSEFWLTPQTLELGFAYLSSLGFPAVAQPHLVRLSHQLNESCSACVLDGTDVVYVARAAAQRIMSENITIGTRFPAYAAAMGRVLLAGLSPADLDEYFREAEFTAFTPGTITDEARLREEIAQVAEQGYSVVDQELEAGLIAVSCPVVDRAGRTVAAVNCSSHAAKLGYQEVVDKLLPPLRVVARDISRDLATIEGGE